MRPADVGSELEESETEWMYLGSDFYCDVAIPHPEQLDVLHEDEFVLAFRHTQPYWMTHLVIVPKRHLDSLTAVTEADERDLRALLKVVQAVARDVELEDGAASVLTNLGRYQDSKHLHVHVYAGDRLRERVDELSHPCP